MAIEFVLLGMLCLIIFISDCRGTIVICFA